MSLTWQNSTFCLTQCIYVSWLSSSKAIISVNGNKGFVSWIGPECVYCEVSNLLEESPWEANSFLASHEITHSSTVIARAFCLATPGRPSLPIGLLVSAFCTSSCCPLYVPHAPPISSKVQVKQHGPRVSLRQRPAPSHSGGNTMGRFHGV